MDPIAAHEALQSIAQELLKAAPADADGVHARVNVVGGFARYRKWAIASDGAETELDTRTPLSFAQQVRALRKASLSPNGGAWFTADIRVRRDDDVSAEYDYDNEPDFGPVPATPKNYADDMERFPRAEENIPDWLRRYVEAAG